MRIRLVKGNDYKAVSPVAYRHCP